MTGYLLQKEMRFTVFPHMAWNPEGESGAFTLGLWLLISGPWLLLSLCPTVLRNLCLSHGPRVAPAPPAVRTSLQAAEKGGWVSTALSVTFLKDDCPRCLQWVVCFPLIGQTMLHDHPRCKGDGKEFIDAFNKIRFPLVKS